MIKIENKPIVDFSKMDPKVRKDGLSGFIRAKNEGEYIYQVIESWLYLVDELVVVFNDCSDDTEDEIEKAINDFGRSKIKAYKYIPKVYPQGSKQHIELPSDNMHSLVNYYNYALSKTTMKYVVKIDGDIIYEPSVTNKIKSYLEKKSDVSYFKLHGVNLIDNFGKFYVPSNSKFCGMNGDLCIFPVNNNTIFRYKPEFESLDLSLLKDSGGCFAYYHMKFAKKDMGFSNYALKENPNSRYVRITKNFIIDIDFLSISEINKTFNTGLSQPNSIGIEIKINRDYISEYIKELNFSKIKITSIDKLKFYFIEFNKNLIKMVAKKIR